MRVLNKIKRLFRNLFRKHALEAALDAELRAFVDELAERNMRNGMPGDEARRQALIETGGIEQTKEKVRDAWFGYQIETSLQDIRYACRSFLRSPAFTVVVIATLGLGIGASLTMFSLMRAVLWRPLPYPEPNRIVTIQVEARNVPNAGATRRELLGIQERSRSLEQASTIDSVDASLEYAGQMEHVTAANISDGFLPLLGVRPALGRMLNAHIDAGERQAMAILISHELWRRRFSGDPGVIGTSVRVNGLDMQIAGVLPAGFRLFLPPSVSALEHIDVWLPQRIEATVPYRGVPILARLKPGVTVDQANGELQTLAAQFEREYPDFYSGSTGWQASPSDRGGRATAHFRARLLQNEMTHEARPALLLLSGAVGLVLLLACVNVANLMLARGSARQRELETRRALGAGRTRIVRQLLTESFVLALASAGIGLFFARLGLKAVGSFSASHIPLQSRIGIDAPVALLALGLSVMTSLLFGLLPSWRLASGGSGCSGRTQTAASGARRLQRMLVVTEVALSIVPVACAGLMLRSFLNLMHSPLGFQAANVLTVKLPIDFERYAHADQQWALLRDVLDRVRAIPGVESVSAANPLPLAADQQTRRVGRDDQLDAIPILATQQIAIPGYLEVMGTRLREGRDFTNDEITAQRDVTIIDENLANRLWPEGAIGRRLAIYRTGRQQNLEVVGVTVPVRTTRVRDDGVPHFMIPSPLFYPNQMSLVIKTHEHPAAMASQIKAAIDAAHPGRASFSLRSMTDYVSDSIGDTRFILFVLAAFAGTALLLASVGLYGTLAYLTTQRTREFGIRLAIGSSVRALVAIVVRESIWLTAVGSAAGMIGLVMAARAIRGLLYGVQPLDGTTLAEVIGLLIVIALLAASVPAWRATRIDPQTSLRSE